MALVVGVAGPWHLLSGSIPAAWNPARLWLYLPVGNDLRCFLSQWEEGPGKHFLSNMMEGQFEKRTDHCLVCWLSTAGRLHPYSCHSVSLPHTGALGMKNDLTFNLFSEPLISPQCDSIQISLRECQTQTDAKLLLIGTVASFKVYHRCPQQGRGYNRHSVYSLLNK